MIFFIIMSDNFSQIIDNLIETDIRGYYSSNEYWDLSLLYNYESGEVKIQTTSVQNEYTTIQFYECNLCGAKLTDYDEVLEHMADHVCDNYCDKCPLHRYEFCLMFDVPIKDMINALDNCMCEIGYELPPESIIRIYREFMKKELTIFLNNGMELIL